MGVISQDPRIEALVCVLIVRFKANHVRVAALRDGKIELFWSTRLPLKGQPPPRSSDFVRAYANTAMRCSSYENNSWWDSACLPEEAWPENRSNVICEWRPE